MQALTIWGRTEIPAWFTATTHGEALALAALLLASSRSWEFPGTKSSQNPLSARDTEITEHAQDERRSDVEEDDPVHDPFDRSRDYLIASESCSSGSAVRGHPPFFTGLRISPSAMPTVSVPA